MGLGDGAHVAGELASTTTVKSKGPAPAYECLGTAIGNGACAMLEGFIEVSPILRPGVYALVRNGVVVYVGQSKKMIARIEAHRGNWGRKRLPAWMPVSMRGVLFDQVFVHPCRVEDLDAIERRMIDFYHPKYNIAIKAPTRVEVPLQLTVDHVPLVLSHPQPRFERRI